MPFRPFNDVRPRLEAFAANTEAPIAELADQLYSVEAAHRAEGPFLAVRTVSGPHPSPVAWVLVARHTEVKAGGIRGDRPERG